MHSKRIFIVTTIVAFIFIFLWIGHATFTSAAVLSGTNTIPETFKLTSASPTIGGRYGNAVAIYSDTLIIGEPKENTSVPGNLFIYEKQAGVIDNWVFTKIITPSDGVNGHSLGTRLAFNGETILAGAATANGNANQSGAAYIFERNYGGTNNWGEVAKLIAPDGGSGDRFGWAVALDGNTAVVGARWHDEPGLHRGSVYIYERNNGGVNNWGLVKEIKASNSANSDYFGVSVAIDKDTIVVGASNKSANGSGSGLVYIFERDAGGTENWGEVIKLAPNVPLPNDNFGASVAIEKNLLAVGNPEVSTSRSGAVYFFERNSGGLNNWGQTGKIAPSDGHAGGRFGDLELVLRGGTLIVNAHHTDGLVNHSGTAYVFKQDSNNSNLWHETAKLVASDGASDDEFGRSISFFENTIAVGSYLDDDFCNANPNCNSGSVYIFGATDPADVAIEKRVSNVSATPNQPITYTLVFTNNGPGVAFNTLITDIVPTAIVNPSINFSGPTITQTGSTSFTWEVAPLSLGESGTITITGIINPDLVVDTIIENTAVITNSLDVTPTNNVDTAVVQIIIPESIYLPVIMKPAPNSFPINISDAIASEPTIQGKTFYTTTIFIPSNIPVTGQFFLSAHSDQISKIGVDDELAIVLAGNEIFVKTFALNGSAIHYEIVEVPRNVMEQMAGQAVSVIYRDVYGQQVSASAVWLIWDP